MEAVSLKLDGDFLQEMERVMKKYHYTTKTEFIREAIRNRMKNLEKEELLMRAKKLYGASKKKTTDADIHRAGEKAFRKLEKEIKA